MQSLETKICIIGAGPSGATLSLFLSKNKVPHVIIDKEEFPRDKVCGDGFTYEVMRTLREYSEELYEEFTSAPWALESGGIYLEMADRKGLNFDFKSHMNGMGSIYVARRKDFDKWLFSKLDKNYATVLTSCEAKNIVRDNKGCTVECIRNQQKLTIECKLLIGSDGERSLVRKTFHPKGIKKDRDHHYAVVKTYFKGVERTIEGDPLEFYQPSRDYRGYFWIFHLPNGECNIGMGVLSTDVSNQKVKVREVLFDFIKRHPELKRRFKNAEQIAPVQGWGIPLNSDAFEYTGDNYLLLGDAAKFGEPFTGKGIGIAMYTAFQALPFILQCIKKDNYSNEMLLPFEQAIEKKYRSEWKRLVFAQDSFPNKFLFGTLVNVMNIAPINKWFCKRTARMYKHFMDKPFVRRKQA